MLTVACKSCGARLALPGELAGAPCKCVRCGTVFVTPGPDIPAAPATAQARAPTLLTAAPADPTHAPDGSIRVPGAGEAARAAVRPEGGGWFVKTCLAAHSLLGITSCLLCLLAVATATLAYASLDGIRSYSEGGTDYFHSTFPFVRQWAIASLGVLCALAALLQRKGDRSLAVLGLYFNCLWGGMMVLLYFRSR